MKNKKDIDKIYARHVNPQWVRLLDILGMNRQYESCEGSRLKTPEGEVLDFLTGYCVYNLGHNPPRVLEALKEEIDRKGPTMLQSHVPDLAGLLAERLCRLAGGRLEKVFFTSSGSEGVETVIKYARYHTKREGILYCEGAFHGLTCGALSLMGDPWWREGFGPLLPGTCSIPFLDLEALEKNLKTKNFAAFVVEPVQSESGISIPEKEVLRKAQELCRKYKTLFVLDEVQTGFYRTGKFLAAHHFDLEPDMLILAKALSGGLIPVGAVLMSEAIYRSVFHSLDRAFIHASTFGENALAMRAGLTVLEVLEEEKLGVRSEKMGELFRKKLEVLKNKYEMVDSIRGLGLMNGLEFKAPKTLKLKVLYESFNKVHAGLFGQMVVMKLFREGGILTQMCGNHFRVIKAAPPLTVSEEELEAYARAMDEVMASFHSGKGFAEGLRLAGRALAV
jgi:ornithine--oxo-acid transaminase